MEKFEVFFSGDVNFSGFFSKYSNVERKGIFQKELSEQIATCNFFVLNLEGPISKFRCEKKRGICLTSKPEDFGVFGDETNLVFNLANNHIMDSGEPGLLDTIQYVEERKIPFFGAGKSRDEAFRPLEISFSGTKVAFFGAAHREGKIAGLNSSGVFCVWKNRTFLKRRIRALKRKSSWVVFNYHGGEEFSFFPMPKRRRFLKKVLDWGADIIVCHHSHVVQGYETIGEKTIFYSLGNFIFDLPEHKNFPGTNQSVLLKFTFSENSYSWKPTFTEIDGISGKIRIKELHENFSELTVNDYRKNWRKDCYRLVFQRKKQGKNSCQNKFGKKSNGIPYFLKRLWRILRNPNFRPVFLSACVEFVRRKITRME